MKNALKGISHTEAMLNSKNIKLVALAIVLSEDIRQLVSYVKLTSTLKKL